MTGLQKIDRTLELLLKMRDRLSDKDNWSQCGNRPGAFKGASVDAGCLNSAAVWATGKNGISNFEALLPMNVLAKIVGNDKSDICAVFEYNDTHTHAEVLALLDRAIAERVNA